MTAADGRVPGPCETGAPRTAFSALPASRKGAPYVARMSRGSSGRRLSAGHAVRLAAASADRAFRPACGLQGVRVPECARSGVRAFRFGRRRLACSRPDSARADRKPLSPLPRLLARGGKPVGAVREGSIRPRQTQPRTGPAAHLRVRGMPGDGSSLSLSLCLGPLWRRREAGRSVPDLLAAMQRARTNGRIAALQASRRILASWSQVDPVEPSDRQEIAPDSTPCARPLRSDGFDLNGTCSGKRRFGKRLRSGVFRALIAPGPPFRALRSERDILDRAVRASRFAHHPIRSRPKAQTSAAATRSG
jgi:hypothetical protein